MARRVNANSAVMIVVVCAIFLSLGMLWYQSSDQSSVGGMLPPAPIANTEPLKTLEPDFTITPERLKPTDLSGMLKQGKYGLIGKEQIEELGADVEQYIPQMINSLRNHRSDPFEPGNRRGRQSRPIPPPSKKCLVWAGKYSVAPLIELLEKEDHRDKAMSVLAAIGPEAQPAMPRLTKLLLANTNLRNVKANFTFSKIMSTMNAISPGTADAEVNQALTQAYSWQADIQTRLADEGTRDDAFMEAVNELSSERLPQMEAAEEVLLGEELSSQAYEELLEAASDDLGELYLSLDEQGHIKRGSRRLSSTPKFHAICQLLESNLRSAQPHLKKILDQPEHALWCLAANVEVLYGTPSEHLEDFVNGFFEFSRMPINDRAYHFLMANRRLVIPLVARRLAAQSETQHSPAVQIIQDLHEMNAFKPEMQHYDVPNQQPIDGLDELTPELLSASQINGEIMCESLFLMRFIEHPEPEVIERLIQGVEGNKYGWVSPEPRMAFETLYCMAYNDPAITQFALTQTKHDHTEHRLWAAKILGLKGADDPRTIPTLTELLADPSMEVAFEAGVALELLGHAANPPSS